MKYADIEHKLYDMGKTLEIGKEEIKATVKNNKKPIVICAIIVAGLLTTGNLAYLGSRYATVSLHDFLNAFYGKFPFSFLF